MTQKRILSLLVSAALLCGLLAGCSDTSDDASHASSSASSPSSSSASSESAPSSTVQAATSGLFNTDAAIEDAYTQWYDNLSDLEQEGFAEAWPMIKEDAAALLEDKDSMAGRLDDVGLEADKLTFSEKDWNALEEVVDPLVPEAKGEY